MFHSFMVTAKSRSHALDGAELVLLLHWVNVERVDRLSYDSPFFDL